MTKPTLSAYEELKKLIEIDKPQLIWIMKLIDNEKLKKEQWLWENPKALTQVKQGLKEAKEGRLVERKGECENG